MNGEAPSQPVEHLAKRVLDDLETYARRDPSKTILVALGAGLVLQALPTRAIVGGVTAVASTLIRPALLALGVVKALEILRSQNHRMP